MIYTQKQFGRRILSLSKGFSAVELLITLFIAAIFLLTGFQLYAVIIKNGGEARQQSSAANVAADYLQRYESSATSPCTPGTPLSGQAVTGSGLSNATVTVTVTCPNITSPTFSATGGTVATPLTNVSKVVATVTYGNSKTVSNSTYVSTAGIVTNGLALNLDAGSLASYPAGGPTWTDLGPNGNNGTLVGGVSYSGTNNGNLSFDGSTGYITENNIPDSFWNASSWTVSAWVYFATVNRGVDNTIIGHGLGGGASLGLHLGERTNKIYFGMYNNDMNSIASVSAVTWYNIAFTYDYKSGLKQIYINNVFDSSSLGTNYLGVGSNTRIGVNTWMPTYDMNGKIAVVQVYNRVLTANEITQNYNALKGRYP